MKFDSKASHGKAGEFYFSYWICNYFGWPCRLLDIDVGIDAQIEIFDENNHSCGVFIGAQIKTNQTNNPGVQVKLNNLEYWSSIDDPIVLISITLDDGPQIYWKLINGSNIFSYIEQAKNNSSETVKISFTKDDRLTISDKSHFVNLIYQKEASYLDLKCLNFNNVYNELISILSVNGVICTDPLEHNMDLIGLEQPVYIFNEFLDQFDEVKSFAESHASIKALSSEYLATYEKYEECISYISSYIGSMSKLDADHDNQIGDTWLSPSNSTNRVLQEIFEDNYKRW
ncbi:DUF4365 domain-containing protein [Aeromonas dhakensis]|uniref:DUF4365 domain-containing protein n=1 Tax=Aeromonas dhakensis TaxID=196024 RepID=UPI001B3915AC|nr:DUF4365 domain-containing protein [Aeromonas dhakensis]MBQ4681635.1 DUF4365 domain-containing protein [Aeromonas dhakensis]